MPPANGCPIPHSKFWIASATEKMSRPQWGPSDIGVRKNPSDERGPKLISAIAQPHATMTAGVRQPTVDAEVPVTACVDIYIALRVTRRGPYRVFTPRKNEYS